MEIGSVLVALVDPVVVVGMRVLANRVVSRRGMLTRRDYGFGPGTQTAAPSTIFVTSTGLSA
jgi:hypothetical protein